MNTNNQTDFGMPIYNLQRMLRAIFQVNGMEPEVIPDGFFNETTEQAVKNFQRMKNMEPTGVVDNDTWDRIADEYDIALIEGKDPICVQLFVREDFKTATGQPRARLLVLQAMLQVMNKRFGNLPYVEMTGVYDAQTNNALALYREMFNLPQGEGMDNRLWYHFVKAYESAVLPYDFERPDNNGYKPEQARQQIDLSRRGPDSMPDALPEEQLRRPMQPMQENEPPLQQGALNRMPMLDSYSSIRTARENEDAQQMQDMQNGQQQMPNTQTQQMQPQNRQVNTPMQQEMQMRPDAQQRNNTRQTRPPLKWNL